MNSIKITIRTLKECTNPYKKLFYTVSKALKEFTSTVVASRRERRREVHVPTTL